MQPGYAVCCSHWLPLRMFPVIAAMKSWRAFWCIVSLSSTGISNPVCTMFNIINFLFFIFFLNPKSGPDYCERNSSVGGDGGVLSVRLVMILPRNNEEEGR